MAAGALLLLTQCSQKPESATAETAETTQAAPVVLTKAQIAEQFDVKGDTIQPEGAVTAAELETMLGEKTEVDTTVAAPVEAVCKMKGCWMKIKLPNSGKLVHVTFKDYSFFVPKDMAISTNVIFKGHAYQDTLTVEELQHYAEDDGKSEKEIAAITKPEVTYLFNATGVLIPKKAETPAVSTTAK